MALPEISAYSQAVGSGQYARVTGLEGKYDNVRVFWEDRLTRLMLQPHLERLLKRRLDQGKAPRFLDLGCGGGDGFETLLSMSRERPMMGDHDIRLVPSERLGGYTGVDVNPDLLEQARERCRGGENVEFLEADLRDGLPFLDGRAPYDVYLTAFGTLSHFHDDALIRIFADVAEHAEDGGLVVADWLGRYAYEWTDLWDADTTREKWMDYRISYIYPAEERAVREIQSFELRLLARDEVRKILSRVEKETGVALLEREVFDRSIFVGRHIDTGDYNPDAVPLRSRVNRLHEPLCRTDLEGLLFDLHTGDGFPEAVEVLGGLHASWSAAVRFTRDALDRWEKGSGGLPDPAVFAGSRNRVTRRALERMARTIRAAEDVEADDLRAEFIEPRLGFVLRDLERAHQRGAGHGHGLVGVYEVRKRRA